MGGKEQELELETIVRKGFELNVIISENKLVNASSFHKVFPYILLHCPRYKIHTPAWHAGPR